LEKNESQRNIELKNEIERLKEELKGWIMGADSEAHAGDEARAELQNCIRLLDEAEKEKVYWRDNFSETKLKSLYLEEKLNLAIGFIEKRIKTIENVDSPHGNYELEEAKRILKEINK